METQDGSMGNDKEWTCIKTEDQPNTWIFGSAMAKRLIWRHPVWTLKLFYPTLSPNGLIVLASFLILNLSYFISNNKNNKETEEKSPAILPSYYGNYAHFPVFSSNSSPYKYIFYTAILHCVIISLRQAYHISFCACLRENQPFFTEACLYLLFL